MRVPWVSVSLLIVLAMLGGLTYATWGDDREPSDNLESIYLGIGWIGVLGSLIVGALGLWARAPATLATALGIVGAGAFVGAWLTQAIAANDQATLHLGMVIAFTGIVIAFSASARRPAGSP